MGLAPNQRAVRVPGGPASQLLADLASLQRDFEMARQFLRHFAELPQDEVEPDSPNQSFWISALTMYGRAFATSITVDDVRAKCRALGMRGADVDAIAGFLQRRKDGRRFNVRSSYRSFQFN